MGQKKQQPNNVVTGVIRIYSCIIWWLQCERVEKSQTSHSESLTVRCCLSWSLAKLNTASASLCVNLGSLSASAALQKVWRSAPVAHSALWSLFSLFHITCPHLSSHTTDCKQYPLYKLKECHTFCCHWSITFSTCYKVSHQACLLFLHKPASVSIYPVSLSCVQAQITWGWGVNKNGEDFYI